MVPRDQVMIRHQGADREVPHQEQTVSELPINCLQRGQSMGRCAIGLPHAEYCDYVLVAGVFADQPGEVRDA